MTLVDELQVAVVIPARYASSRFPGKPLAMLGGKPVLRWVTEAVSTREWDVFVATDDIRIADAAEGWGSNVVFTSDDCQSGTDRCAEALRTLEREEDLRYDVVVNVQGDEPFVDPVQLRALVDCFDDPSVQIATLATPIRSVGELMSPNNVKVVVGDRGQALYFSRQPIPYRRDAEPERWLDLGVYYKHVGVYAYRASVLQAVCRLPQGALEQAERLEQLRWLAAGHSIAVRVTPRANIGIDTPEDLAAAEAFIEQDKKKNEI
ncbi:MAG: 3-deoxy-manno-octulosonate cytidylyltransferase [Bacteroidales bacterium]|nr:3-deoxy-manno-octulosonate cytidylyltransferase [Bacteroidales bacterium]